jgi:hypothetical protein
VRRAALEAVREALTNGAAESPRLKGRAGAAARGARAGAPRAGAPRAESARAASPAPAARAPRASAAKPVLVSTTSGKPGQKRDPKLLQKLVDRLAAHIAAKPGQRIEQINKPLGVPTKDLSLPIKKLLRANRIIAKGQKRSTTYWPK